MRDSDEGASFGIWKRRAQASTTFEVRVVLRHSCPTAQEKSVITRVRGGRMTWHALCLMGYDHDMLVTLKAQLGHLLL